MPLNFRYLGIAAAVGIVSMVAMLCMAERAELLGLAGGVVVSAAIYGVVSMFSKGASKNSMIAPSGERTENDDTGP